MRGWLWLALVVALAPAAAQPAAQPEACRAPIIEFQEPPAGFEPGSSTSLLMAIENPNGPPVDNVRASVATTAPPGWTAIPAQRELTLGPSNVSVSALAVTAPNRGSGAGSGNITILVTFVCSSGEIQTRASSLGTLPVSLSAFRAPWPVVLTAFALLAGGVTVLGVRRLRRGIAISPRDVERDITPGKGVKFTFVVDNRRGRPQRLRIRSEGVPPAWTLHLALESVDLEPGEEKALWAILKAPITAPPGLDVAVTLHLEDARGGKDAASAVVRARVLGV